MRIKISRKPQILQSFLTHLMVENQDSFLKDLEHKAGYDPTHMVEMGFEPPILKVYK